MWTEQKSQNEMQSPIYFEVFDIEFTAKSNL